MVLTFIRTFENSCAAVDVPKTRASFRMTDEALFFRWVARTRGRKSETGRAAVSRKYREERSILSLEMFLVRNQDIRSPVAWIRVHNYNPSVIHHKRSLGIALFQVRLPNLLLSMLECNIRALDVRENLPTIWFGEINEHWFHHYWNTLVRNQDSIARHLNASPVR